MPLSDWQPLPVVTTGDLWTAAQHNTYIRQNQQVLRDALGLGHGQGSNVDMVDGRHAEPGMYPGLVPVDTLAVTLAEGTAGWVTFSTTSADGSASGFVLVEGGYGASGYATVEVVAGANNASRVHVIPERAAAYLRAVRVVDDGAGMFYLQIYAEVPSDGNGARTLNVYRYSLSNEGVPSWELNATTPTVVNVHTVAVLQNGAWRLARAETGSGVTSWLTPPQMQSIFSGSVKAMDGNWGNNVGHDVLLTSSTGIIVDGVKFGVYSYGQANPGPRTVWLYLQYAPGGSWTRVYTSQTTPDGVDIFTYTFSPTRIYGVRAVVQSTSSTEYVTEIQVKGAVGFTLYGVPYGCSVRCYDSSGTLLEEKRQLGNSYVSLSVVPEKISITRPDGATVWLEFPSWAIDGGAISSGDVLTLYQEV